MKEIDAELEAMVHNPVMRDLWYGLDCEPELCTVASAVLMLMQEHPEANVGQVAAAVCSEGAVSLEDYTNLMAKITRAGYLNLTVTEGKPVLTLTGKAQELATWLRGYIAC